jgi:hypothetical protein
VHSILELEALGRRRNPRRSARGLARAPAMNALPVQQVEAGGSGRRRRRAERPSERGWLRRNLATVLTLVATAFVLGGLVRLVTDRHVTSVVSFQDP